MQTRSVAVPEDSLLPDPTSVDRSRGLSAGLLSVVLHGSLLVAIGLLAPQGQPAAGTPERRVGITLVERSANHELEYFSEQDSQGAAASEPAVASTVPAIPNPSDPTNGLQDSAFQLPTAQGANAAAAAPVVPNAGDLAAPRNAAGRGQVGGKTRTQVFGAQGEGNEFVYVFDRSSSMGGYGGRPMVAARRELETSLRDLVSVNQFQIVFYNETPTIFNPFPGNPPQMFFATDENRELAQGYIRNITPAGGTRHKEALEIALRMGPDVIFFLTDAAEPELSAAELAQIRRKNRADSIIHAVEFGAGPFPGGDNFLIRLARQNRGQHVYVDVTNLESSVSRRGADPLEYRAR